MPTLPTLLEALCQPGKSSGTALQALREVMSVQEATVFPVDSYIDRNSDVGAQRASARFPRTAAGNTLSRRPTVIVILRECVDQGPTR